MHFQFEKLEVYKDALDTVDKIYRITKQFPKDEMFGLTSQLRRAGVSVPSNIAEGSSRGSKEFSHFIDIGLGSCYECVPLLEISNRQEYILEKEKLHLYEDLHKIAAKMHSLKAAIRR